MDSFFHFDAGYRILNGEHPFKDFWVVSGPTVDYIQAVFFYIFGTNWQSYVLHASLFNALLTISTFFILQNFKLKNIYCFIYSSFFAILAYPSSGTPFADHHSAFFSLLGIYSLLLAINNKRKMYWILLPILLGFSFLDHLGPPWPPLLPLTLLRPLSHRYIKENCDFRAGAVSVRGDNPDPHNQNRK